VNVDVKKLEMVNSTISSYPTQLDVAVSIFARDNDDDNTVVALNCSHKHSSANSAQTAPEHQHYANMFIEMSHAIADTGATSIFVMEGTPMENIKPTMSPITINLPDGKRVMSTHMCNITIPGLPTVLMGHMVPGMKMASLFGIRILCKAGCTVTFNDEKCVVRYINKIILQGYKDPKTDLWTLPITGEGMWTTPGAVEPATTDLSQLGPCKSCAPLPPLPSISEAAGFLHARTTKSNAVKFAHQSLCNPPIYSLLKAINAGFLKGAPNLDSHTVRKCLMASPATSKGHMKRLRKGLRSPTKETPKPITLITQQSIHSDRQDGRPDAAHVNAYESEIVDDESSNEYEPQEREYPNIIPEVEDKSFANVFCFGAFADKMTGVVYNDCTGNFPFMSLDGNVCFLVMYH
jgi:hypothetical protein